MTTRKKIDAAIRARQNSIAASRLLYDAFISYSRHADSTIAKLIQSEVQRLGKPWYRRRSLRLFRDDTNLAANPSLWQSIELTLDSSRFLIVLCSPQAAQSTWVKREIEYWLVNKSIEKILLVVTGGKATWCSKVDGESGAHTKSSFPDVLVDAFPNEPRFIDLRWAAEGGLLRPPRFQDAIADLAAPLYETQNDMIGENLRQLQARKAAKFAIAALCELTFLAARLVLSHFSNGIRPLHNAMQHLPSSSHLDLRSLLVLIRSWRRLWRPRLIDDYLHPRR